MQEHDGRIGSTDGIIEIVEEAVCHVVDRGGKTRLINYKQLTS